MLGVTVVARSMLGSSLDEAVVEEVEPDHLGQEGLRVELDELHAKVGIGAVEVRAVRTREEATLVQRIQARHP